MDEISNISCALVAFARDDDQPVSMKCFACNDQIVEVGSDFQIDRIHPIPPLKPNDLEREIYVGFTESFINGLFDRELTTNFISKLRELQKTTELSRFSQFILEDYEKNENSCDMNRFVEFNDDWITRPQIITCMDKLKRYPGADLKQELLVVGTDTGRVLIIDLKNHACLKEFIFPNPISLISACGTFDQQYRIFVTLRGCNSMHVISDGRSTSLTVLPCFPLLMISQSYHALVACNDDCVYIYNSSGIRVFSMDFAEAITCMSNFAINERNVLMWAVGLADKTIRIYTGSRHVSTVYCEDIPISMTFGRFGGEQHCLMIIGQGGGLSGKTLKRSALFTIGQNITGLGPPLEQDTPFSPQAKSQLFTQEVSRQKHDASTVHDTFTKSMARIKAQVENVYQEAKSGAMISKKTQDENKNPATCIQVQTEVIGIGPLFKLVITLGHTSDLIDFSGLSVVIASDCAKVSNPMLFVPLLVSQRPCKLKTMLRLDESRLTERMSALPQIVSVILMQRNSLVSTTIIDLNVKQ